MTPLSTTARAVAAVAAVSALATACTAGAKHDAKPAPTGSHHPVAAAGVITGVVAVCAGPPAMPPRPATVSVLHGQSVATSAHVVAGEPGQDRYRVTVSPGNYVVQASNWPDIRHRVDVRPDSAVRADFPNICD